MPPLEMTVVAGTPIVISTNEDMQKSCEEMVYIFHSFFARAPG